MPTTDQETEMDEREIRQWNMLLHLGLLAGYVIPLAGVIVPLVMWQTKKDESPEIDAHGRMVANAILSYVCYMIGAVILSFLIIGIPLVIALVVVSIAFPIIGAIKANDGVLWRYPLVISFV